MIDRPRKAELGSIPVITSLIGPETVVKAPICMQGITATGEHFSYEQKRDDKKRESMQHREQHFL